MPARTIYLIKRLETEVTARMIETLGIHGITPSQYIVLSFVGDSETDLSSAQLSRRFLMTPQSMNEVVTTLQRKELLEKKASPDHKRILRISLTEKGKQTLALCDALMDELEAQLLAEMEVKETEQFRDFLSRLVGRKPVDIQESNGDKHERNHLQQL